MFNKLRLFAEVNVHMLIDIFNRLGLLTFHCSVRIFETTFNVSCN